jgi:hypothetical protein
VAGWRGRVGPYLIIATVVAATVAALSAHPQGTATRPVAEQVIVAGAVGLRWDDVDPLRTPHLWRLAERGSIASMSVRSAHRPTCAADGWLTLGAGNWAAGTASREPGPCPSLAPAIEPTNGVGAHLPEQAQLVRHNELELPWGAVPGALAGSVGCTVAVGDGAAVAAARSYGRVDRYAPTLPRDPQAAAGLLADHCELAIVDLGTVSGTGPARVASAEQIDAALGRLLVARPAESLLLVAGVAEVDADPHLQLGVAEGPGLSPGWLTSETTGRTGYLQLVDIAPTVLAALERPQPQVLLAGHPAGSRPGRPVELSEAVADLAAADHEASLARPISTWFLAVLTAAQLVLFVMVVPLLRLAPGVAVGRAAGAPGGAPAGGDPARAGPAGGPAGGAPAGAGAAGVSAAEVGAAGRDAAGGRGGAARSTALAAVGRGPYQPPPTWWRSAAAMLLVAAALAIPAAQAAGALPWWRAAAAGSVFTLTSLAVLAGASVLVVRTAPSRRVLGLVGAGAAVATAAVAVDLATGSWLQLNSVLGYLAHDGGRFAGLSDIGLGVLIAGTLLLAGCLAEQVPRRRRPVVVVLVGAVGVVLAGSPFLGDEIGGAVALAAGVAAAAALCTGGWLTTRRVGWASVAALTLVAAVAVLDLRRPVEQRTGLGGMLTQLAEGTAGFGLQRVSLANVEAFTDSPLTVLAIGAGVFLWFGLLRPWGGLKRLFAVHPALRAAMVGAVTAALLGGVLVGAALTVAGAAAAVGVPLLTLASLRLRERLLPAVPLIDRTSEPVRSGRSQVLE